MKKEKVDDKHLSRDEYDTLDFLATRSRMDCWFMLKTDKQGNDYVFDLEENKKLSLKDGVAMMYEGLTDLDDYNLYDGQKEILENLFRRLGICE